MRGKPIGFVVAFALAMAPAASAKPATIPALRVRVPAGSPRVLGSELHVWNDVPYVESVAEIARGSAPY
jgi:hypothetical protein